MASFQRIDMENNLLLTIPYRVKEALAGPSRITTQMKRGLSLAGLWVVGWHYCWHRANPSSVWTRRYSAASVALWFLSSGAPWSWWNTSRFRNRSVKEEAAFRCQLGVAITKAFLLHDRPVWIPMMCGPCIQSIRAGLWFWLASQEFYVGFHLWGIETGWSLWPAKRIALHCTFHWPQTIWSAICIHCGRYKCLGWQYDLTVSASYSVVLLILDCVMVVPYLAMDLIRHTEFVITR